jgi:hypothetical protein
LKKYGKIVREKEREKNTGKMYVEKSTGKSRKKKKKDEKKEVRKKSTAKKVRQNTGESKGKSHVTSDDVASGQTCAMVRSCGSSTWILHKFGLSCTHILLVGLQVCLTELIFD